MFFRFQAVNDLVTELEQANITCAATITFAENDYKEQLQTLKVKNTLELVQFFPTALFIYFFFFIYVFVSRDSRLPFEIRLSTLLSFPCETNTDIEYTYFDFNGSCRHEKDLAKRELIVIELHERSSCRVENRRRDGSRR